MTLQDARKTTIIEELKAHRLTNAQAAELLDLSIRQVQRLKKEAAAHGIEVLLHGNRGRKPPNTLDPEVAGRIVSLYREELPGYNFAHAADVLAEEKGIFVSSRTVARYLAADGIRSPHARRRPKRHRSRKARRREGELAEMDASKHDWFGTGSYENLHGAVDDATGRVLALWFDKEETLEGYAELMFQMNQDGRLPRELYTDARSVFDSGAQKKHRLTLEEELAGQGERVPQFARALRELGIVLIIAKTCQAKGGIERLWETLQDRLPKDLKRKGIHDRAAANVFLRSYVSYLNRKFMVPAQDPEKAYLPRMPQQRLQIAFAHQVPRKLDQGLAFSYASRTYRLPGVADVARIQAAPHDTVVVATSPKIGMKVLYKGLVLDPEPLEENRRVNFLPVRVPTPKQEKIPPEEHGQPARTPWRQFNPGYFASVHRDDIIPVRLTHFRGDIIPDR